MIEWSTEQKDVINADDSRLLVSASAGSGKTTVMIERIARLVKDGVKLSNMLICTFTKASAADMRLKLQRKLAAMGLKSDIKDLPRADISTIDSFCQRLVSRYFYVIGVDSQFEVLEDSESRAMKRDAIERVISSNEDGDFADLCNVLRSGREHYTLKEAIMSIINSRAVNPDFPISYDYDEEKTRAAIEAHVLSERNKIENAIEKLFEVMDEPQAKAELLTALMTCDGKIKIKLKEENEFYEPCCDYLKERIKKFIELKEKVDALMPQRKSHRFIEALLKAADKAWELYAAEKYRRASVDFADLESMALSILRSDAASEIQAKYKYVFVDEYQDINPLQESIIQLVANKSNLFMVGDLKQSIYAFRGCAPEIFKAKYDRYSSGDGGRVINLDTNYRSNKKIIEFVNSVFGEIMTDEFGGVDYKNNPMTANKDGEGYVKLHIVEDGEVEPPSGIYSVKNHEAKNLGSAEAEATLIVYRIVELLKSSHNGKPVSFGDIALLTRSMGELEKLVVEKLRSINVPVSLNEDAYYLYRPETGQLINFLRLIDNRRDDKAMAISMLSPLGGFSENELAGIRLNGSGKFYECVLAAAETDDKIKAFIEKLDRYYELSLTAGVDELADTIVSECGYFNYAFGLGDDAAEVLDKFLEFLGSCPYKNSLRTCLKFIDEHNPFVELTGDEQSVKLMTIHKSKGLEFKYVFVIGLGDRPNIDDIKKHVVIDKNISMNVYEDHAVYNSDLRFLMSLSALKKSREEDLRILYVAFTRAEEGLELFGTVPKTDKMLPAYVVQPSKGIVDLTETGTALKWLAAHIYSAHRYDLNDIVVVDAEPRQVVFSDADEEIVGALRDYFAFTPPVGAPAKSYVSKLAHADDEPAVYIVEEPSEGNALERGNAYHKAMEVIDFSEPNIDMVDDIDLIDKNKLLAAAKNMRRFDGKIYKEKPFMLKLSAKDAGLSGKGDVLVQGVIDLLIINGDEATIVDYKTGAIHGSFEQGYFKQVNLYALAVERLLGKKVVGKYLYYFDAEAFVEIA